MTSHFFDAKPASLLRYLTYFLQPGCFCNIRAAHKRHARDNTIRLIKNKKGLRQKCRKPFDTACMRHKNALSWCA